MDPITFTFIANDGHTYPVRVNFLKRLPSLELVGHVSATDFRNRASLQLHTVLPRMRVVVTVDDSAAEFRTARADALYRSGSTLADQLFIALQMAR